MPVYLDEIAEEFEHRKEDFRSERIENRTIIDEFIQALKKFEQDFELDEIIEELLGIDYPGAVPSSEFKEHDGIIVPFEDSCEWTSHESVNRWAKERMKNKPTIGVDGSQINSTPEFNRPIGFVQAACIENQHTEKGDYEREIDSEILTTGDLLQKEDDADYVRMDEQEVHIKRFEKETGLIQKKIKENKDLDPPPVVFYDGSLLVWFLRHLDPSKKERYGSAMAQVLAASQKYRVPVVGYVSGSRASEIKNTLQNMGLVEKPETSVINDYKFVSSFMENWGDRTILFKSQQSTTIKKLRARFEAEEYDFSDKIMFTYLNTGEGPQLDRVEMPKWILDEGFLEYTMEMIRGECCVGRGYPEILQQADADAVISSNDRERVLKMYQKFAEENDIELRWNNKARSKKRRRR